MQNEVMGDLFVAGILEVEKGTNTATNHQRRKHDANQHFGFTGSFRALPAWKQYFAQKIIRHLRRFKINCLITETMTKPGQDCEQ